MDRFPPVAAATERIVPQVSRFVFLRHIDGSHPPTVGLRPTAQLPADLWLGATSPKTFDQKGMQQGCQGASRKLGHLA